LAAGLPKMGFFFIEYSHYNFLSVVSGLLPLFFIKILCEVGPKLKVDYIDTALIPLYCWIIIFYDINLGFFLELRNPKYNNLAKLLHVNINVEKWNAIKLVQT